MFLALYDPLNFIGFWMVVTELQVNMSLSNVFKLFEFVRKWFKNNLAWETSRKVRPFKDSSSELKKMVSHGLKDP